MSRRGTRLTLLPAYSIGQQAQTTTLAHTLLSWEAPFARDAARALALYAEAGGSPAGSAIMTGSTFPISRTRTAELLGFDSVQANTRDAVVNLDTLLHAHSVIAIAISNAVSVASDLYLWSMSEFRFVELDDAYCSTSSIMPQKKNAWAPAWIRGQGSLALGRLAGVFALAKMESDGLEDTLLGPWQLYEALDELEDMVALLAGMVATMTCRRPSASPRRTRRGWTQATDLAAMLTREAGISWRDAHQVPRASRPRSDRCRPQSGGRHARRHRPRRERGARSRARRHASRRSGRRSIRGNRSRIAVSSRARPRPPTSKRRFARRAPRSRTTPRASMRSSRGSATPRRGSKRPSTRCSPAAARGSALNALAKFGARRLLFGLPTIWLLITVVFVMVHLAPGDPLSFITGEGDISSEQLARLRAEYGPRSPAAPRSTRCT